MLCVSAKNDTLELLMQLSSVMPHDCILNEIAIFFFFFTYIKSCSLPTAIDRFKSLIDGTRASAFHPFHFAVETF